MRLFRRITGVPATKKPLNLAEQRLFLEAGGESGTRTPDLRIMIPSL
jgi:hypothetical protein